MKKIQDLLQTKTGKYYMARKKAKTKSEAAAIAGISPTNIVKMENNQTFKALERHFKDEFLAQTNMQEIAATLKRNMMQERDIGGSNNAIKLALERIEPDTIPEDQDQQIMVIMAK